MKNLMFNFAVATAIAVSAAFTGCQSADQKADRADAKVEGAKETLQKAEDAAAVATQKAADVEAWKLYKAESEAKIKDNETYIAALKTAVKTSGKKIDAAYAKSIDVLEQRNKDLRTKMDAYDGQSNWDNFKKEINHDMEGLGAALKDLGVNNKK